jgi:hypothetical protein
MGGHTPSLEHFPGQAAHSVGTTLPVQDEDDGRCARLSEALDLFPRVGKIVGAHLDALPESRSAGSLADSIKPPGDLRELARVHARSVPAVRVADRDLERAVGIASDEDRRRLDP